MTIEDARTLLATLQKSHPFQRDIRNSLDSGRKAAFTNGWRAHTDPNRQAISDKKLSEELTWSNLGYRVAHHLNAADDMAQINEMHDALRALFEADGRVLSAG